MASSSISGLDAVFSALNAWQQQLTSAADAEVQNAGIECEAGAKQRCPVGTPESTHKKGYVGGRLRSSIAYKPGYLQCSVGTNVEYAWPVETGHVTRSGSFVPAQPYMFPSFVESAANLQDNLRKL